MSSKQIPGSIDPMTESDRISEKDIRGRIPKMSNDELDKYGGNKKTLDYIKKKVSEDKQYKIFKKDPI